MIWHKLVKTHALDFPLLESKITIIIGSDFKLSVFDFKVLFQICKVALHSMYKHYLVLSLSYSIDI